MPGAPTPGAILEAILKHPGRVLHEISGDRRVILATVLLGLALAGFALYGIVAGSLAGGDQLWIAPAKLVLGCLLSMLICLPSLYIFTALDGMEARIGTVCGALLAAVCLSAMLLIGFAPVAWIFSQSTDSVAFMGALHLLFWTIGILFGFRLLRAGVRFLGGSGGAHLSIWCVVFFLVCLQMTTTLRPILGRSPHFLPAGKKFFLAHWSEIMTGRPEGAAAPSSPY